MTITSPAFTHNQLIPSLYTCDGKNISPPLLVVDVPGNAQSLVLLVDDPDAPMGTWVHWTVWNIDPAVTEIPENSVPKGGVQGTTSFGTQGYGSPCPPSGVHRYFFKLFALDMRLDVFASADAAALTRAMEGHVIAEAELVGLYSRGR